MENEIKDYSYLLKIKSFVYFLKSGDDIVYVGSTTNGLVRPLSHIGSKDFDGLEILECSPSNVLELESEYIFKIKPLYNKHPGLGKYISLNEAKRVAKHLVGDDITMRFVKDCIRYYSIPTVTFLETVYIDKGIFCKACACEATYE